MVYKILIVGLKRQDAGKTSLALALLTHLRDNGYNACAFKPRAGNNVWYDYDIVYEVLSQGRLYGSDAARLKAASALGSEDKANMEELINPVHRLWAEPPLINPGTQIYGFIIDRVTLEFKDGERTLVLENETLSVKYRCPAWLLAPLRAKASSIYHVHDLTTLNTLIKDYYNLAIELAYKKIIEEHECVVIESYSDIALPWNGLKDLNAVIGIKPGLIAAFDPKKYLAAVQIATSTYSQEELATAKIIELLQPLKELRTTPFRSEEVVQGLKEKIHILLHV